MLDRYLLLAPLVTRVIMDVQRSRGRATKSPAPQIITPDEEEVLREVKDLLAPLARATKELSTEKLPTLSKAIPIVNNLRQGIDNYMPASPVGFNLQQHVSSLLKENFDKLEEVPMFAAATLLDPRFKTYGFHQDLTKPRRVAKAMSYVADLVKANVAAQREREREEEHEQGPLEDQPGNTPSDSFWDNFDRSIAQQAAPA